MPNSAIKQIHHIPALRKRKKETHKGSYGKLLVIACSKGMTGCGFLSVKSAYRVGCGLIKLALPESQYPILASKLTSNTFLPLPENKSGSINKVAFKEIKKEVEENSYDAIAMGPGLGQNDDVRDCVFKVLEEIDTPKVVDADALNVIASDTWKLQDIRNQVIITPHPGEMFRLISGLKKSALVAKNVAEILEKRKEIAVSFARLFKNLVLVLKGYQTIVTDGDKLYINKTGGPSLAKGGTGDVLTGMIAGFLAQGYTSFESALLGVYYHGLAGDLATKKLGEHSVLASDLLNFIPQAMNII